MATPKNLICIGASAGGLQAVTDLLHAIPDTLNDRIAVILAQHLSPTYKSRLSELLSRETQLSVVETSTDEKLSAGKVYICPPDREIYVKEDRLNLIKSPEGVGPKPSVNSFISSVSDDWAKKTIAVILSGTGSDGALGVKELSKKGGIVMVQSPEDAKYDGMPRASIATNLADYVGTPDEIGMQISEFLENGHPPKKTNSNKNENAYHRILKLLSKRTGSDFSNYKSATINRRLDKRLSILQIRTLDKYLDYCHKYPDEIDKLFETVLIGVTEFFRDFEVFDNLKKELKTKLKKEDKDTSIRIWIPGCASGEEAYSIAMLMAEILGIESAKRRVQIFASDIDQVALVTARDGIYAKNKLEKLPKEYRKYLMPKNNDMFQVIQDIKSFILWSKHDVIQNPPFMKLDLISCRNLLIYFNLDLQKHIFPVFHKSLKTNGFLQLGKSETVGNFGDHFETISSKTKLYSKRTIEKSGNKNIQVLTKLRRREAKHQPKRKKHNSLLDQVKINYLNEVIHPMVVINEDMEILEIIGDINDYLKIKPGQMSSNIIQQAINPLQIEIRSSINKAKLNGNIRVSRFKKIKIGDKDRYVRLVIKPATEGKGNYESLLIIEFESIAAKEIGIKTSIEQVEDSSNNARIIELERELDATKEDLQSYLEELETANEELQSLNEELQSANEELQSANEELETSNEELQSTNEEVQIAYSELSELNNSLTESESELKAYQLKLSALINNTMQVFIMLDVDYRIQMFNQSAVETIKDLFDKVIQPGKNLLDYFREDVLATFFDNFKKSLKGEIIKEDWKIKNRLGIERHYFFSLYPVEKDEGEITNVIFGLLDVTDKVLATKALSKAERLNKSIYDVLTTAIVVSNVEQMIVEVNDGFVDMFGYSRDQIVGNHINIISSVEERKNFDKNYQKLLGSDQTKPNILQKAITKSGEVLSVNTQSSKIEYDKNILVVTSIENITEISSANLQLLEQQGALNYAQSKLKEIIKVQNAILSIALLGSSGDGSDKLLEKAAGIIGKGFQKPEAVCIKISHGTDKFINKADCTRKEDQHSIPLMIEDVKIGNLSASYQKKVDGKYPDFLPEEIEMLTAIANLLSQILENRKLNKEIADSAHFLDSTVQSITDGVLIFNRAGHHININKAFVKMIGFDQNEIINSRTPHLYWPEENAANIQKTFAKTLKLKTGDSFDAELIYKRKNGERFPVLSSTSKIQLGNSKDDYFISIIKDITDQKQREQQLIQSESNYRFVYDNTIDMISRQDVNGILNDVSPSSKRITGYEPKELIGKSFVNFCHEDDKEKLQKVIGIESKANNDLKRVQYRFKTKDDDYLWLETYSKTINEGNKGKIGVLSSTRDINSQKKQESQLSDLIDALQISNNELKEFAYVASHDLREPLRMISSFVQLLDEKYGDSMSPEAKEYIGFTVSGTKRLQQMIDDLLEYSRVNTHNLDLKTISSQSKIDEVVNLLSLPIKENNAKIRYKNLPNINVVPGLFERLMLNLISNGIKYHGEKAPIITISSKEQENHWLFEVRDNGIGIDKQFYEKIFVIFKRLHNNQTYKGTGIGLAVCKRIVQKHGGDIWVKSKVDKGSSFYFTIPK